MMEHLLPDEQEILKSLDSGEMRDALPIVVKEFELLLSRLSALRSQAKSNREFAAGELDAAADCFQKLKIVGWPVEIKQPHEWLRTRAEELRAQEPAPNNLCVGCGKPTEWCCADCRIDLRKTVHVCESPACRDKHEQNGCTRKPLPQEPAPPKAGK